MTDVVAGRYALVDPIAAGGFGTVWRAFDRRTGRYCAAKLLRQRDAGELLRFVREQSVRLTHPHIVGPYSWAAEDGTVLIASELVAGGSVHTLLGDWGPLSEGTVVTVVRQLLAALQAVHEAELIHRDVKPANLLLHATGTGPLRLALTDFGLTISRRDARLTQVGMVIGTPGYLPPEVLAGGVPPDPRHDLYAVGRLAVTLLAGAEPEDPAAILATVDDPVLRTAIEVLLRPDPGERPDDAAAAADLVTGAAADERPRTADGDPVDVMNQLPPLPPGWGYDGPVTARPTAPTPVTGRPRGTVVDVAPTAPAAASAASEDAVPAAAVTAPVPGPGGSPSPVGTSVSGGANRPMSGWSDGAAGPLGPDPATRASRPVGRRGVLVAAAAGGVALVTALVLVLPRVVSDDPASTPPATGSTPPTTPASSASTTAGTPSTRPSGSGASGPVSIAPPAVTPSATVPLTSATLAAGAACTWQQEGNRETGVDGVLVCTRDDAGYAWRPA